MDKLPITVVAQVNEVTVFQTAALAVDDASHTMCSGTSSMRQTGRASYGEMNLGLHVQDNADQVLSNRMHLLAHINQHLSHQDQDIKKRIANDASVYHTAINSLHWVNQIHGHHVYDIDNSALSMQPVHADAMISQQPGVGLAIMTADCVPIVLYQPKTGKIAAIHAGWQGLACGVIKSTAAKFDLSIPVLAWIGVCISQENYEVDGAVRDQLLNGGIKNQLLSSSDSDSFDALFCVPSDTPLASGATIEPLGETVADLTNTATVKADKIKLNLPKLAAHQLTTVGIEVCTDMPPCSYGDAHYYSYRRQTHLKQAATGRMALVIVRSHGKISTKMNV